MEELDYDVTSNESDLNDLKATLATQLTAVNETVAAIENFKFEFKFEPKPEAAAAASVAEVPAEGSVAESHAVSSDLPATESDPAAEIAADPNAQV